MFVHFGRLPFELRRDIWKLALPKHRVMEIDRPLGDNTKHNDNKASFANSRPPLITRVCRESRSVAFEEGGINGVHVNADIVLAPGVDKFIDNAWFNPRTDVVHMNYSRPGNIHGNPDAAPINPVHYFLATAEKGVAASITADLLLPFAPKMEPRSSQGASYYQLKLLECRKEYFVSLRTNSLHLDKEAVLTSGLFGELGEERLILVGVEDSEKLQQLYGLWKASNREGDEPEATFFNLAVENPERFKYALDQWEYGVKSHWIFCLKLLQAYPEDLDQLHRLMAEIARSPTAQEVDAFRKDPRGGWQYTFYEEDHPFVKTALEAMPNFKPMIMFRLCDLGC